MEFLVQDSRNAGAKIRILRKANVEVRWGWWKKRLDRIWGLSWIDIKPRKWRRLAVAWDR